MAENKTVKYHIPHRGIYMYSHVYEGKTEMKVEMFRAGKRLT